MINVMITGAGLAGAHIAKRLSEQHDIKPVLVDLRFRREYLDTLLDPDAYTRCEGSITDAGFIRRTLQAHDIDRVIHTAAVLPMRVGHAAHPGFFEVNTNGTSQLLFAAREYGVQRFVMFSTNGVYQFQQHAVNGPVTEDFPVGLSPHNAYGNSKAVAESLLREVCSNTGMAGNIVRPGEIFGPVMSFGDDQPIYWKRLIDAALSGERLTLVDEPAHRLDWVHVEDVAWLATTLAVADSTPHVAYHAASGRLADIHTLKAALDEVLPHNRVALHNCGKTGWNHPLSIARAEHDLDYVPRYDLSRGIREYARWAERAHPEAATA